MRKYTGVFFVGSCEVQLSVQAENENKARQLLSIACLNSNGSINTVKLI